MDLSKYIRAIPDFPEKGIVFRDVTTLFADPNAFSYMIRQFQTKWSEFKIHKIAGIDARGFIIGGALAHHLGVGFVPLRKKGKLPHKTISEGYSLEYGEATLELHIDAFKPKENVLIIDDLIATGGTIIAAVNLVKKLKANVIGCSFLVDLPDLGGSKLLKDLDIVTHSLCSFDGV